MALVLFGLRSGLLAAGVVFTALATPALAATLTVENITETVEDRWALTIPTFEAVDSNLDEAGVRAFFATEDADQSHTLAGLQAKSVTIPELTIAAKFGEMFGTASDQLTNLTIRDIRLDNVSGGYAGSFSIGSVSVTDAAERGSLTFGPVSVGGFNYSYLLKTLRLIMPDSGEQPETVTPLWRRFSLASFNFAYGQGSCALQNLETGALAIRQLDRAGLGEIIELAQSVQTRQGQVMEQLQNAMRPGPDGKVPPMADVMAQFDELNDDNARLQSYYMDLLTAYDAEPMSLTGFACDVTNPEGHPISIDLGRLALGETEPGVFPDVTVEGVRVADETEGFVAVDSIAMSPIDFSRMAAAYADAGSSVDADWLVANARKLIAEVGGVSVRGLAIDVPDSSDPGSRIVATFGGFDMTFDNYVNGFPSVIRTGADDIRFSIPRSTGVDPRLLDALGLSDIVLDYSIDARWNRAAQTIRVNNATLAVANVGTVKLSGMLGNASALLFSEDPRIVTQAASGLTLIDLKLEITDARIIPPLMAMLGAQQGLQPEQFQAAMAGMVQGTVLMGMQGSPDSFPVSQALAAFINGAPNLTLSLTALSPRGLPFVEITRNQNNPGALLKLLTLTAETPVAEAAPVAAPEPPPAPEQQAPAGASEDGSKDKEAASG